MKNLPAAIASLFAISMLTMFACSKPPAPAPTNTPEQMLNEEIDAVNAVEASGAGCMAPLKSLPQPTDPKAATMQAIQMMGIAQYCERSAPNRAAEAHALKLSNEQNFTLQCIRTSVSLSGKPKNDEDKQNILNECSKEYGVFSSEQK